MRDRRLDFQKHAKLVELVEQYRELAKTIRRLDEEEKQSTSSEARAEVRLTLAAEEEKFRKLRREIQRISAYLGDVGRVS